MMILSYSGEAMLTTDRLGVAVIDYARALVEANAADVVEVPVVWDRGEAVARLLIGPMSQLVALPTGDAEVELDDERAVAAIRAKIEARGPSHALPSDASPWDQFALVYDFL
jgi:hypothetical protein